MQFRTSTALTQSLDCAKLLSAQAQIICSDPELTRLDGELTSLYHQKLSAASNKNRLRADQRAWLRDSRNACGDKGCLLRTYQRRIDALKRMQS
jgi:uncharacterized protein